jgi:hypothetical protein
VTAWSLGMQMGVTTVFVKNPVPETARLARLDTVTPLAGSVEGNGARFIFDYKGADAAIAINRLLKDGAAVSFERTSGGTRVVATGVARSESRRWRPNSG